MAVLLLAALLAAPWPCAAAPPAPGTPSAPDTTPAGLLRDHLWRELNGLPAGKRPVVGLVLSAGSARGNAHVGVISILEASGFPIDVVAGTSMGAIVGSVYAGGATSRKMLELTKSYSWSEGSNYGATRLLGLVLFDSLLSSAKLERFLGRQIAARRFDQLKKPFACVAMDLHSGEPIIFREGDLAPAVRASMSLPGIFEPVEYRHRYLVDGGVVAYIPVDAARLLGAEWILASVTEVDYSRSKPKSVLAALEQVIDIRGSLLSRQDRLKANFVIEPQVGDIGLDEFSRIPEAVEKGAITAHRDIQAAMESLLLYSLPRIARTWAPGRPR